MKAPDVAVVGLGAHGVALVHEMSRRGASVIGLDAFTPPHEFGSTTGRTRISREAYYEDPLYVPLVQRAGELWAELEELTGTVLYRPTGGLMAGPEHGELVQGALASARQHDLPHELLDSSGIRHRFPVIHPPEDAVGVYEPNAGVLLVDACMRTLFAQAAAYGADLRTGTRVTGWRADTDGVTLRTTAGDVQASRAVFTVGSWLNPLLASESPDAVGGLMPGAGDAPPLQLQLAIERQTTHLFEPAPGVSGLRAGVCPVTMLERADGHMLYTLPDVGHGVKAALHHGGETVHPHALESALSSDVDRTIGSHEEQRVRFMLDEWMPGAAYRVLDGCVCLYTNTPDRHFVIDHHPSHDNVLIVSACSGHGFKFAPAIAEIVTDLSLEGDAMFDISLFGLERVRI